MIAIPLLAGARSGPLTLSTAIGVILLACGQLRAEPSSPSAHEHFVHREGDRLLVGNHEFRFISFRIPYLHQLELHFSFDQESVRRWPNEFEITDALESIRQLGGKTVEINALSLRRNDGDDGDHVHVQDPGQFNEEAFRTLDKILQIANQKGIRLVIPLVGSGSGWGGIERYAAFRGKPADQFWTDPQILSDFKKTIRFVLERTNTQTEVMYRDDRAILGWATGNALNAPPAWTQEIARYLKSLDPNHLVIDGNSGRSVSAPSLDDANIDVVTTRHDAKDHRDVVQEVVDAIAIARGKKPYFVSDLRGMDLTTLRAVLDAVVDGGASGVLVNGLHFHRRDGGFYWRSEPTDGNGVRIAYHWPGFASGEEYGERQIIDLLRQEAARIRNIEVPQLPVPLPPHLLPISRAGQIRWRGSAGAVAYEVQRSEAPDGPWKPVGQEISDAETPYRSLFSDNRTELNKRYFYRVIAKNETGPSPPSAVVGPVNVAFFEMVDEFKDALLVRHQQGPVEWIHHKADLAYEDFHRLRLKSGGSVIYQVGEPMRHVTLLALHDDDTSRNLDFAISRDGTTFTPLQLKREEFTLPGDEMETVRPVRYDGDVESDEIHFLRITLPGDASDAAVADASHYFDLSRLEIRFARKD